MLGLVRRAGDPGDDLRLETTRKGERWLAESAKGRLKAICDHLLSTARNPRPSAYSAGAYADDLDDLDDLKTMTMTNTAVLSNARVIAFDTPRVEQGKM